MRNQQRHILPAKSVYIYSMVLPIHVLASSIGTFEHIHCKKEKKILLIYKKIQKWLGAKLYMRQGFLTYEEICKNLVIYEMAVSNIWHCIRFLLNFLMNEESFFFFFNGIEVT